MRQGGSNSSTRCSGTRRVTVAQTTTLRTWWLIRRKPTTRLMMYGLLRRRWIAEHGLCRLEQMVEPFVHAAIRRQQTPRVGIPPTCNAGAWMWSISLARRLWLLWDTWALRAPIWRFNTI